MGEEVPTVTDEELERMVYEMVEDMYAMHCSLVALIQMLVDNKAFKRQDEASVMEELENRAKDIKSEEITEARIKERVRKLREAWSKLPKQ